MEEKSFSKQIDDIIGLHSGWKGDFLTQLRTVITQEFPKIVEEVKWKTASRPEGLPVWSYNNGIVCIAEVWSDNVKLIFFKGALISDPSNLFNARLKSKTDRAIELREGDTVNHVSLKRLIGEAVKLNS